MVLLNLPDLEDVKILLSLVRRIGGVVEQGGNITLFGIAA
jgi:UDP-N-acetylglucosamine enolpyruvyl transferase